MDSIFDYRSFKTSYIATGPRIVESEHLVENYEDWSEVRSPARARRRMKRGFRQRVRYLSRPQMTAYHDRVNDVIYMHPAAVREMKRQMAAHVDKKITQRMQAAFETGSLANLGFGAGPRKNRDPQP